MPVGKLFAIGLPIALGVVMIGAGAVNFVGPKSVHDSFVRWGYPAGFHRVTGGLEATAGLLLLVPATWWAGTMGSVVILVATVITVIRCRTLEWSDEAGQPQFCNFWLSSALPFFPLEPITSGWNQPDGMGPLKPTSPATLQARTS